MPGQGRPELGKGVAAHPSGKTERGAQTGVAHTGLAICPPGIGNEVVAGNTGLPGIGRGQFSVSPACDESHHNYVLDPTFDRLAGGAEIPGILSPQSPTDASIRLPLAMPVNRIP